MATSELVRGFLNQLEPEDVPVEYIASASIKDRNGQELTLTGKELQRLMSNHPDYSYVQDARIYINLHKVAEAIHLEVEYICEQVDLLFLKQDRS